jgi:hypothetical protein
VHPFSAERHIVNKNHSHYHGFWTLNRKRQMAAAARTTPAQTQQSRAFWLKHLHQWHWVSAAACLIGLLLFSITGFTLNHASWISSTPVVSTSNAQLPELLVQQLRTVGSGPEPGRVIPVEVGRWLLDQMSVRIIGGAPEWSADELYVSLPRPGGDAWLTIDLANGAVTHEITRRGWISYLNDLHKGRNAGAAWSLFIDVFAFAVLIFASTGLLLLKMHAAHRPATWPMVTLGLVLPVVLALLFIH